MKVKPEDLHNLAEDLQGVLHRHPWAIQAEPDIASHIVKARDLAEEKFRKVSESESRPHP